jgi:lipopolysaccharide export system protein LptC
MKGIISLGVFIFLAIAAWWTITTYYNNDEQAQQTDEERFVVAYMNDFEMTAMDANGSPGYTLKGEYMERFNNSNETKIHRPIFQLLQPGKQWEISADSAIVNDKHETIQLSDNVVMRQQSNAANNTNTESTDTENTDSKPKFTITIRTPNLLIRMRKQIAETQSMVTVTQGNSKLSSDGMIFNNITNELELSSNVHGSIIPND